MPEIVGSILIGADDLVIELVRSRIPEMQGRQFAYPTALGVVRRGQLVGGVVYHEYRGHDVQMSAAFDTRAWATEGTLRALWTYPFITMGCARATMIVARKNKRARKFLEHMGMTLEGVLRKGLDGVQDAFVYGLLREDCRWIKEKTNG
jgi:RimJ/RimL family protein N-acetyltransferase